MSASLPAARPASTSDQACTEVTAAQISEMVDQFYAAIRNNDRLGPLFDRIIQDNWPMHLERMKTFWRSVLLKSGEYSGRPVPAHMAIADLREDDFRIWLALFEETATALFGKQSANQVTTTARRIARSLWLARFATPHAKTPEYLT
jgi:hemoglobin